MLNLLELKYNNVTNFLCMWLINVIYYSSWFARGMYEHAIVAVVTYTNLHFHIIIHYDKLCFGPRRFVSSWKNMSKRAHMRFLFFTRHIFIRPTGKRKRKKRSGAVNDEISRNVIFRISPNFFLTIRTLAIRVIAQTTSGERENVLHDNLYEGLIVSINEPRLKVRKRSTMVHQLSARQLRKETSKWNELI